MEQVVLPAIEEYKAYGGVAEVLYGFSKDDVLRLKEEHYVRWASGQGLYLVSPATHVWYLQSLLESTDDALTDMEGGITQVKQMVMDMAGMMHGMTWLYGEPSTMTFKVL